LVTFPACEGDKGDSSGEDKSDGKGPDGEKGRLLSTQLYLLQSGLENPFFFNPAQWVFWVFWFFWLFFFCFVFFGFFIFSQKREEFLRFFQFQEYF
jgi:hypothetical protein